MIDVNTIEKVAVLMNRYMDTVKSITAKCVERLVNPFVQSVETGIADPEVIWNHSEMDEFLAAQMQENWTAIAGEEPYWQEPNEEDRLFIFKRLKRSVFKDMLPLLHERLAERIGAAQRELAETLQLVSSEASGLLGDPSTDRIWAVKRRLDRALEQSFNVEKMRIYLSVNRVPAPEFESVDVVGDPQAGAEQVAAAAPAEAEHTDVHPPQGREKTRHVEPKPPSDDVGTVHVFDRKLKGGFVPSILPSGTFVPEMERRRKNIEHGDLIRVVKSYPGKGGRTHYDFEVQEKKAVPQPERVELKCCLVKRKPGSQGALIVNQYCDSFSDAGNWKPLTVNGLVEEIELGPDDTKELGIKEGHVIEMAYWANNPGSIRVVWNHSYEERKP